MKNGVSEKEPEDLAILYRLDGRPRLRLALPVGLQHVVAMFTGNLAPIVILAHAVDGLTHLDRVVMIQCAMLMAGVMTMLQCYPIRLGRFQIGSRLPVVMGTSFAFVPTMRTMATPFGIPGVLGGALVGGFVELLFGLFIRPLKRFFPPLVIGSVLITIGISLLRTGAEYFAGGINADDFGSGSNLFLGFTVFAVITLINRFAKGMLKTVSILVGIVVGYVVAICMGKVHFPHLYDTDWLALPQPLHFLPEFHLRPIISFAAVYIIVALETMGNTAGITMGTLDRDTTPEETSGTIVCAAVGSQVGALFNSLPLAAFGQNSGIVSMTGVINRFCVATGAAVMILTAFCPKIGAVFASLPASVLGGAVITVFAMIFLNGIKMVAKDGFSEANCLVLATTFGLGYGLGVLPTATVQMPPIVHFLLGEPITAVCLVAVLANLLFNKTKTAAPTPADGARD